MIKIFIIILIVFVSYSCKDKEPTKIEIDASLNITKTEEGFNIFSNTGILILEFTELNCDSSSLETLNLIYETAKEFYNLDYEEKETGLRSINLKGI